LITLQGARVKRKEWKFHGSPFQISEETKVCPRAATDPSNALKYSLDVRLRLTVWPSDRLSLKLTAVKFSERISLFHHITAWPPLHMIEWSWPLLMRRHESRGFESIARPDWTYESGCQCAFLPAGEQILPSLPNKCSANQVYCIYCEPYEYLVDRCHRLFSLFSTDM
jgi:hypothetical protein